MDHHESVLGNLSIMSPIVSSAHTCALTLLWRANVNNKLGNTLKSFQVAPGRLVIAVSTVSLCQWRLKVNNRL